MIFLLAASLLLASDAFAQTFCSNIGTSVYCDGDRGPSIIAPLGRNGAVILDQTIRDDYEEKRRARQAEEDRRAEERRRAIIYGDERRDRDSRSRSRSWDEDDGR